jgi:hypothetical protein
MISSINSVCAYKDATNFTASKTKSKKASWISIWINDKDKVCTDGRDDGKISFKEKMASFGKGLLGLVKAVVKRPIATLLTFGLGVGLTVITGGAILPVLVAAGIVSGLGILGYGIIKAARAKTDAGAKQAWESIGNGTFALVCSLLGMKSSLKAAAKAGVKAAEEAENLNLCQTVAKTFKVVPDAVKISVRNTKGNFLTYTTGQVHANSNATRKDVQIGYQSGNGNKVEAYKIDLNGSVEEVLAKNPGVSYEAETGKYYVQTSWGAKSYIDPAAQKGYMFVKYGPGDINAVEGVEFADTYVDHAKLASTGVKSYIDPSELEAGKTIAVAKEAPARFKIVPEGTKYVSAEGPAEVQPKSVLRIDGQGRPYQSTVEYMLKKVQLTPEQIEMLKTVDSEAVEAYLASKK